MILSEQNIALKPGHHTSPKGSSSFLRLLEFSLGPTFPYGSLNQHPTGVRYTAPVCLTPQFYPKFSGSAMPYDHCSISCSVKSHPARLGSRAELGEVTPCRSWSSCLRILKEPGCIIIPAPSGLSKSGEACLLVPVAADHLQIPSEKLPWEDRIP